MNLSKNYFSPFLFPARLFNNGISGQVAIIRLRFKSPNISIVLLACTIQVLIYLAMQVRRLLLMAC